MHCGSLVFLIPYPTIRENAYRLAVDRAGALDGSADFENGTLVTLFVRPEPDSTFIGWSGDCTGIAFSTTVTLDADKTCTANFQ